MLQILTGGPGSGKTKALVQLVNNVANNSKGNVICVEKKRKLVHEVTNRARLIATDDYAIAGFDAFYGLLAGICASDHDITDIFVDATLRIGSRDANELLVFLQKVAKLASDSGTAFTFTISADDAGLPAEIFNVAKKLT